MYDLLSCHIRYEISWNNLWSLCLEKKIFSGSSSQSLVLQVNQEINLSGRSQKKYIAYSEFSCYGPSDIVTEDTNQGLRWCWSWKQPQTKGDPKGASKKGDYNKLDGPNNEAVYTTASVWGSVHSLVRFQLWNFSVNYSIEPKNNLQTICNMQSAMKSVQFCNSVFVPSFRNKMWKI